MAGYESNLRLLITGTVYAGLIRQWDRQGLSTPPDVKYGGNICRLLLEDPSSLTIQSAKIRRRQGRSKIAAVNYGVIQTRLILKNHSFSTRCLDVCVSLQRHGLPLNSFSFPVHLLWQKNTTAPLQHGHCSVW